MQLPHGEDFRRLPFAGSCRAARVLCRGCSCLHSPGTRHLRQAQEPGSFMYHNFTLVFVGFAFEAAINRQGNEEPVQNLE